MAVSYFSPLCAASLHNEQLIHSVLQSLAWSRNVISTWALESRGRAVPRAVPRASEPHPEPGHILQSSKQLPSRFSSLFPAKDSVRKQQGKAWQE